MIGRTGFVLADRGVEIARHPHRVTCVVEAVEKKLAVHVAGHGTVLKDGVTIEPETMRSVR